MRERGGGGEGEEMGGRERREKKERVIDIRNKQSRFMLHEKNEKGYRKVIKKQRTKYTHTHRQTDRARRGRTLVFWLFFFFLSLFSIID